MEKKDLFLNMMLNPDASARDLTLVGFNADNIHIGARENYKKDESVLQAFSDEEGKFDELKFNQYYDYVQLAYNQIATNQTEEDFSKRATYYENDIFAPAKQRNLNHQGIFTMSPNPYKLNINTYALGESGSPTRSIEEIAQTRPTWDPASLTWMSSPNDSFWEKFFDTRVLAQWDKDGTHEDPFTGEMVAHKKGDFKTDDEGYWYYEFLNGRNPAGKVALNKLNTLTVDGSKWNRWDPFDSDDVGDKSVVGELTKDTALVGSMFLPKVGKWVAAGSALLNITNMGATVAKAVESSEDPSFIKGVQAWTQSLNRQTLKTLYQQEHTFALTNILASCFDMMGQIREQRAIFETLPKAVLWKKNPVKGQSPFGDTWGRGKKASQEIQLTAQREYLTALLKERRAAYTTSLNDKFKKNAGATALDAVQAGREIETASAMAASDEMNRYIRQYQKLGEVASKVYMAGLISTPIYDEARAAGIDSLPASLLTLGRFGAEMALLSTPLGNYFLPELRALHAATKNAFYLLAGKNNKQSIFNQAKNLSISSANSKEERNAIIKKLLNLGSKIVDRGAEVATAASWRLAIVPSVISGVEAGAVNMMEELLSDVARQVGDLLLLDDPNKSMKPWEKMFDRYGMGMVAGLTGGTLASVGGNYTMMRNSSISTYQDAWLHVVSLIREGREKELEAMLNKIDLGDRYLSATDWDENLQIFRRARTKDDTQDAFVKSIIRQQILLVKNILNSNGLSISDKSVVDSNLINAFRWEAVQNSAAAYALIKRYNDICTELALTQQAIDNVYAKYPDTAKRTPEIKAEIEGVTKEARERREQLIQEAKDIKDGKATPKLMRELYLEMSPNLLGEWLPVNFLAYAELVQNKKISDIDDKTLEQLKKDYEVYINTTEGDLIAKIAEVLTAMGQKMSKGIADAVALYKGSSEKLERMLAVLNRGSHYIATARAMAMRANTAASDDANLEAIQSLLAHPDAEFMSMQLKNIYGENSQEFQELSKLEQEYFDANQVGDTALIAAKGTEILEWVNAHTISAVKTLLNENNRGFLNVEAKQALIDALRASARLDLDAADLAGELGINEKYLGRTDFDAVEKEDEMSGIHLRNLADFFSPDPDVAAKARAAFEEVSIALGTESGQKAIERLGETVALIQQIEAMDESPIRGLLNELSVSTQAEPINVSELVKKLDVLIKESAQGDITDFNISGSETEKLILGAINLVRSLRMLLNAAKTDQLSAGNKIGYNHIQNEVVEKQNKRADDEGRPELRIDNWQPLLELSTLDADVFIPELNALERELTFYVTLNNINKALKLSMQDRVGLNFDKIVYNRMKSYIAAIKSAGTPFDGIDVLDAAFNSANTLIQLIDQDAKSANPQLLEAIFKENLAWQDALYDFFQNNKDRLSELISLEHLSLASDGNTLLTLGAESLDDVSFVHWLTAHAAIKASDFYSEITTVIQTSGDQIIAPIPTQVLQLYINYAAMNNASMFDEMLATIQKSLHTWWENASESEREAFLINKLRQPKAEAEVKKKLKFFSMVSDNFMLSRCILSEGIPGAGKSTGTLNVPIRLLAKNHPDSPILNHVMVVHGSNNADSAKALKESLALPDSAESGTKTAFLQSLSPDYKEGMSKDRVVAINKDTGALECTLPVVSNSANPYSLIIIDEVSNFTTDELLLVEKYCKANGIVCLCAGDFDQTSAEVAIRDPEVLKALVGEEFAKGGTWVFSTQRNCFVRGPKLGVSMRTANTQKDANNTFLMAWVQETLKALQSGKGVKAAELRYCIDDNTFTGDAVVTTGELTGDSPANKASTIEEYFNIMYLDALKDDSPLVRAINIMFKLAGDEKVGFIGVSEKSPLYLYLKTHFAGKFESYIDVSALGREAKYYIIEPLNVAMAKAGKLDIDRASYTKNVYTALTRAAEGSLLVNPESQFFSSRPASTIFEGSDSDTVSTPLPASVLIKYSKGVLDRMNKVLAQKGSVTYIPSRKTSSNPGNTNITAKFAVNEYIRMGNEVYLIVKIGSTECELKAQDGSVITRSIEDLNNDLDNKVALKVSAPVKANFKAGDVFLVTNAQGLNGYYEVVKANSIDCEIKYPDGSVVTHTIQEFNDFLETYKAQPASPVQANFKVGDVIRVSGTQQLDGDYEIVKIMPYNVEVKSNGTTTVLPTLTFNDLLVSGQASIVTNQKVTAAFKVGDAIQITEQGQTTLYTVVEIGETTCRLLNKNNQVNEWPILVLNDYIKDGAAEILPPPTVLELHQNDVISIDNKVFAVEKIDSGEYTLVALNKDGSKTKNRKPLLMSESALQDLVQKGKLKKLDGTYPPPKKPEERKTPQEADEANNNDKPTLDHTGANEATRKINGNIVPPRVSSSGKVNIQLMSFNTLYTGLEGGEKAFNPDTIMDVEKFLQDERNNTPNGESERIDCFYGMARLYEACGIKSIAYGTILQHMIQLRNVALSATTLKDLQAGIDSIFSRIARSARTASAPKVAFTFIYKQIPGNNIDKPGFNVFNRQRASKYEALGTPDSVSKRPPTKLISLVIANEATHTDFLELPIFSIENPYTATASILDQINQTKAGIKETHADWNRLTHESGVLLQVMNSMPSETDSLKLFRNKLRTTIAMLSGLGPKYKQLVQLFKTYYAFGLQVVRLDNFCPGAALGKMAPRVVSGNVPQLFLGGHTSHAQIHTLSELREALNVTISPVYQVTTEKTLKDASGLPIRLNNGEILELQPGQSFVFYSFNNNIRLGDLARKFIEERTSGTTPTVSILYVTPPKGTFELYIKGLHSLFHSSKDNWTNFGNGFDAVKILNALFASKELKLEALLRDPELSSKIWSLLSAQDNVSAGPSTTMVLSLLKLIADARESAEKDPKNGTPESKAIAANKAVAAILQATVDDVYTESVFPPNVRSTTTNQRFLENFLQNLFYKAEWTGGGEVHWQYEENALWNNLIDALNKDPELAGGIYYQLSVFKDSPYVDVSRNRLYVVSQDGTVQSKGSEVGKYSITGMLDPGPMYGDLSSVLDLVIGVVLNGWSGTTEPQVVKFTEGRLAIQLNTYRKHAVVYGVDNVNLGKAQGNQGSLINLGKAQGNQGSLIDLVRSAGEFGFAFNSLEYAFGLDAEVIDALKERALQILAPAIEKGGLDYVKNLTQFDIIDAIKGEILSTTGNLVVAAPTLGMHYFVKQTEELTKAGINLRDPSTYSVSEDPAARTLIITTNAVPTGAAESVLKEYAVTEEEAVNAYQDAVKHLPPLLAQTFTIDGEPVSDFADIVTVLTEGEFPPAIKQMFFNLVQNSEIKTLFQKMTEDTDTKRRLTENTKGNPCGGISFKFNIIFDI